MLRRSLQPSGSGRGQRCANLCLENVFCLILVRDQCALESTDVLLIPRINYVFLADGEGGETEAADDNDELKLGVRKQPPHIGERGFWG